MALYEQKKPTDITFEDITEYSIPTVSFIREKGNHFIFTYVHNIVERICIYDTVQKNYRDQIKYIYNSEDNGGCYDNAIYGIRNPANGGMRMFKMPEYHEYMKDVKYDFTGKLDFDEDFENPVVIEQILK
jgi:hypothetical protein